MASQIYATIKLVLQLLPRLAYALALHLSQLSITSKKWDLRTAMTVAFLRGTLDPSRSPSPLKKTQATTLRETAPKGKMWIAPVTIPKFENGGVESAVFDAIEKLGDENESYTRPTSADMRAEWTGYRSNARDDEKLPNMPFDERYKKLMSDPARTNNTTVLYFHGGAYYLCGLDSHRDHISKLAKACGGRALAVEYRLAPQAAFPSQLIDALNAYLYLLYPPKGALHTPVPASDIVFGGDSAGGNLSFALLQLLLQMRRTKSADDVAPTLMYNGHRVKVPLPAGVTACSGWFDLTRSMESIKANAAYDYLPLPDESGGYKHLPRDDIWPTTPPRGDIFCDVSLLCHPLCSPIAASDWSGSPPLWMSAGDEMLTDEIAIVAKNTAAQGVHVQFEHYEAMPHCSLMLLPHLPSSVRGYKSWGRFCADVVAGKGAATSGTYIRCDETEQTLSKDAWTKVEDETVARLMRDAKSKREQGFHAEATMAPKPAI